MAVDFVFELNPNVGGGGGGGVTNVGTGTGLTGGPITSTGVISLATVGSQDLLANLTGGTAAPLPHTLSAIMDYSFDNVQGGILFRSATQWTFLAAGVDGQALITGGPGADPSWAGGAGGSVTEVDTGAGLTGGPITTTGTISLATVPSQYLLANITGGSAAPTGNTLTSLFDVVFNNVQGSILYRNDTVWTALGHGTAGQLLQTGGAAANPSWTTTGAGTVTSVATGAGLTGGPITTTGTISFATISNHFMLANISGVTAVPSPHSVSDVLDNVFTNTQGSILYRASAGWSYLIPGTDGYVLTTGGASENPSWQPGGGGGGSDHNYVGAQWGAQNGSTGFVGTNINAPKLGMQAMIDALPTGGGIINIPDNGTYGGAWVLPSGYNVIINAPGATLPTTGITMDGSNTLTVYAQSFGTMGQLIANQGALYIYAQTALGNYGDVSLNPSLLRINADTIAGDFTFPINITATLIFNILSGTITDSGALAGYPTVGLFGNSTNGDITSTYNRIYGNVARTGTGTTISGVAFGSFGNQIDPIAGGYSDAIFVGGDLTVLSQSVRTAVAGCLNNWALARGGELINNYVFKAVDTGSLFTYTGSANITVYAPSDADEPWLPAGWFVYIQQADNTGTVTVAASSTGDGGAISSPGSPVTAGPGSLMTLNLIRGQNNASTRAYGFS